jgi:hypothetical protein
MAKKFRFEGFIGTLNNKKISILARAFLENLLFYFFLHKSWIWRALGRVMNIFSYWHFHNALKEHFGQINFKFHAPVQKCHFGNFFQNGIFEPVHEI